MATRLQRTIYIGAGGTGIETVLKVRNYFKGLTKGGSLPPMIKFLFIDTDENTIWNIDDSIKSSEILSLAERNAKAIYSANEETYSNYTNTSKIRALVDGAGQFRSHGRFSIMSKEEVADRGGTQNSFSQKFKQIYQEIMNIHAEDEQPEFETLGNNVEVHIAFSMSGGTGAGSFLSLAYLIRQIMPTCKIFAYAFSHNFFMNLPISAQIQQNTYASLLELDYCMSSDNPEYQDVVYPGKERINRAPFDIVMYIDNKTYTYKGMQKPHVYTGETSKEQVEKNVAYAMAMSAGYMGAGNKSVLDNWIEAIMGGQYDVTFSKTKQHKRAWVSSLGVSEIICEASKEQTFFANNLSLKILKALKDNGKRINSASSIAYNWVKDMDLNESGQDDDHDYVINHIISPDEFMNKIPLEIDQNNVDSGYSLYEARINNTLTESTISQRKNNLISEKKQELLKKVQDSLFELGSNSICVTDAISIVNQFVKYMDEYKAILGYEISGLDIKLKQKLREWSDESMSLNEAKEAKVKLNRANVIASIESSLRAIGQKRLEIDENIRRRKEAIDVFDKIGSYALEIRRALENLNSKLDNAIVYEENKITDINTSSILSENHWGTIDLSKKVYDLPTVNASDIDIDFSTFFKSTKYNSVLELANQCDNIADLVDNYSKQLFNKNNANDIGNGYVYPIVRVIKNMSDDERNKYLEKAALYSLPLMDVQTYGENDVQPTESVCVAIPNGNDGDAKLKEYIKKALKINKNIKWIDINDPNRILIFRQIGVIPPYFIDGISKGKNSISLYASCQEAFEKKDNPESYCPFTDKQFDDIYHKKGFTLDSNKRKDVNEILVLWVKSIVYGIVVRDNDGQYKVESESGVIDMDDDQWRKFKTIGSNRHESFQNFADDNALCKEVEGKINKIMRDPENTNRLEKYKGNHAIYANEFVDKKSDEWQLPEVKKQYQDEMSIF